MFRLFAETMKNPTQNNIHTLRSDNGGEYLGNEFQTFLAQQGIRHETSAAYTPAQNGVAERTNRTLMDGARNILIASRLPQSLWAEALTYTVYIKNRILSGTNDKTPFELWNERKPNFSNIRIFYWFTNVCQMPQSTKT